jgi:hypothetical protein
MAVPEIFPLNPVQAQESSVTTLDPIVVTGSAHSTQLHQSTQSVTILKTEQFAPLQPNRVVTMLQPKSGSWGLPEMRDCLYGSGYEDYSSFPNRSPCG